MGTMFFCFDSPDEEGWLPRFIRVLDRDGDQVGHGWCVYHGDQNVYKLTIGGVDLPDNYRLAWWYHRLVAQPDATQLRMEFYPKSAVTKRAA